MTSLSSRFIEAYRQNRIFSLLKTGVTHIGDSFFAKATGASPRKIGVYNGVAVRNLRISEPEDVDQTYESPLISAIEHSVGLGQDAIVIGGGLGVSTVTEAKKVGKSGSVVSFEGSSHRIKIVRETVELNQVEGIVRVRHAVVGDDVNVFLDSGGAGIVDPADLPDCDVLISDCEGAELNILNNLESKPDTIIVETHGNKESSTSDVQSVLDHAGYEIVSAVPENKEMDVYILTATLKSENKL